ncbi:981_t:CDS:2 [Entrophospora sp. SA101]|nr:981_t:CDS:2 [Entrophospora sp. SA101]CAJ0823235.1 4045_t:CDS:2 [Entrophospora sp. SA101]
MHSTLYLFSKQINKRLQHIEKASREKAKERTKEKPPWMVMHHYKQAMSGLYAGETIKFGDQVSKFGNRSRRSFKPNVQKVKLYSVALDERIRIKCTTTALKHIDLKGGLDRYLLTMKDDKLGKKMYDLKLKIMDRLEEEKKRLAELDGRLLDNDDN